MNRKLKKAKLQIQHNEGQRRINLRMKEFEKIKGLQGRNSRKINIHNS
jgi:hypothetical protein